MNRSAIRTLTLDARRLLTQEVREQLEGVYGLKPDGRFRDAKTLPAVQELPEVAETWRQLERFLEEETAAGLGRREAVEKLIVEAAFTHLNRLVAFKMLEARKLIQGTINKHQDSNGFKLWLARDENAADYALYERGTLPLDLLGEGPRDVAYRHFLLAQCARMAAEIRVLFDPDTVPSRLFPRPNALRKLIDMLNGPELAEAWALGNDETVGWVYQYFNEEEKAEAFERLYKRKQKIRREDIPAVTQLFTPRWIVTFLVHNTLGRHWLQMHPDSRLSETLEYLVPMAGGRPSSPQPPSPSRGEGGAYAGEPAGDWEPSIVGDGFEGEQGLHEGPPSPFRWRGAVGEARAVPPKPVRDIHLLDPACGTMHFGLVAFDLLAMMYREEIEHAGEPGWPAQPSVASEDEIPAAIVANNLFGIDIDLRAVQLSALTLYLKAKSLNPKAVLTESNLACADVLALEERRLEAFLERAKLRPIYGRLIRGLWARLHLSSEVGSLLRLEDEVRRLVEAERDRYRRDPQERLPFAELEPLYEAEASDSAEFWTVLEEQVVQAFDHFAREQAEHGIDERYFVGEATKGMRLLDVMRRRYDVVVTNPPYMTRRNMMPDLAAFLEKEYPRSKSDLYAAFIERCAEILDHDGRLGMVTQQSFMFISSYEALRGHLLQESAIEAVCHSGPHAFEDISGEKVNTVAFTLRREPVEARREDSVGTYFRLVKQPDAEAKRLALEGALAELREGRASPLVYRYRQGDFDAIPGSPWVYWITPGLRRLFVELPKLGDIALPRQGLATADNFRFLRFWWETGVARVGLGCETQREATESGKRWFPYMKGGEWRRWYGNQEYVVNWRQNGAEVRCLGVEAGRVASRAQNTDFYFRRGVTWTDLTQGRFGARLSPGGFVFDVSGSSVFPPDPELVLGVMNSEFAQYALKLLNPTVHVQVGDLARLPIPHATGDVTEQLVERAIGVARADSVEDETTYDFVAPPSWQCGITSAVARQAELAATEREIDEEVYRLYGIGAEDRAAIERELAEDGGEPSPPTPLPPQGEGPGVKAAGSRGRCSPASG